ncbi:hypothetical protein BRADI_2g33263v3 [Brachypodium distachyon]|uniref:Obg domain-containing protein n=1 Tax=Brachypodium distachyon TaxID=15368 RepID=A0A2K2DBL3_BRADI|nr:hypothetical protein BRADI_2g33263v3 [Brachypodium distachyon]
MPPASPNLLKKCREGLPSSDAGAPAEGSGCARGGDGGNGCVSQSSQGRTAKAGLTDFSSLQHHTKAGRGGHGLPKNQIGTRGSDKVAQVPVGTVIHLGSTGLHRHLAE